MVRIGLSLYLMLAAAAGPSFCCCTTVRLADLLALPMKDARGGHCCATHLDAPGQKPQKPKEHHPGKPGEPGGPSCPCKEGDPQQTPLASLDSGSKALQSRHSPQGSAEFVSFVPAALPLSPESNPNAPGKAVLLPFLTSEDLLCAHHILRC